MRKLIVGIDPGKKGAIAVLSLEGEPQLYDMPEDEYALVDILAALKDETYRVIVEKQQPFPKQGVSSTFRLARHYGVILGILRALRLPFEEIPPQRWQRALLGNGRRPRARSKKLSLEKARALFPNADIGQKDGRSDALLIAEYGRRLWFGITD